MPPSVVDRPWYVHAFGPLYLTVYGHRDDAEARRNAPAHREAPRRSGPTRASSTSRAARAATRAPSPRWVTGSRGSTSPRTCSRRRRSAARGCPARPPTCAPTCASSRSSRSSTRSSRCSRRSATSTIAPTTRRCSRASRGRSCPAGGCSSTSPTPSRSAARSWRRTSEVRGHWHLRYERRIDETAVRRAVRAQAHRGDGPAHRPRRGRHRGARAPLHARRDRRGRSGSRASSPRARATATSTARRSRPRPRASSASRAGRSGARRAPSAPEPWRTRRRLPRSRAPSRWRSARGSARSAPARARRRTRWRSRRRRARGGHRPAARPARRPAARGAQGDGRGGARARGGRAVGTARGARVLGRLGGPRRRRGGPRGGDGRRGRAARARPRPRARRAQRARPAPRGRRRRARAGGARRRAAVDGARARGARARPPARGRRPRHLVRARALRLLGDTGLVFVEPHEVASFAGPTYATARARRRARSSRRCGPRGRARARRAASRRSTRAPDDGPAVRARRARRPPPSRLVRRGGRAPAWRGVAVHAGEPRGPRDRAPELASGDVVGRVFVQDAVFPVVAIVAGPTEAAYLAQIAAAHRAVGLAAPTIVVRPSATWVEAKVEEALEAAGVSVEDAVSGRARPPEAVAGRDGPARAADPGAPRRRPRARGGGGARPGAARRRPCRGPGPREGAAGPPGRARDPRGTGPRAVRSGRSPRSDRWASRRSACSAPLSIVARHGVEGFRAGLAGLGGPGTHRIVRLGASAPAAPPDVAVPPSPRGSPVPYARGPWPRPRFPSPPTSSRSAPTPTTSSCARAGSSCACAAPAIGASIVDLTRGESGSRGTPEIRARETAAASAKLGLVARENLGLPDGGLEVTAAMTLPVVAAIRRWRPSLVVAPCPVDLHPDHTSAAELVKRAYYLATIGKVDARRPARPPGRRARPLLRAQGARAELRRGRDRRLGREARARPLLRVAARSRRRGRPRHEHRLARLPAAVRGALRLLGLAHRGGLRRAVPPRAHRPAGRPARPRSASATAPCGDGAAR